MVSYLWLSTRDWTQCAAVMTRSSWGDCATVPVQLTNLNSALGAGSWANRGPTASLWRPGAGTPGTK